MKDLRWAKKTISELRNNKELDRTETNLNIEVGKLQRWAWNNCIDRVLEILNQLDEPEVLSQEWIDKHAEHHEYIGYAGVPVDDLQNLLVPKREEVDRAYKDGYEKGKQHTFYKGYLQGLEDKGSEPETVADVLTTFWKSYERLKEVMNMEVEELEE